MASTDGTIAPYTINAECKLVINKLCLIGRRADGVLDPADGENADLWRRLDQLLADLETKITMTPAFKTESNIHRSLEGIFDGNLAIFPKTYVERAKQLHDNWELECWGAPAPFVAPDEEDEFVEESDSDSPRRASSASSASLKVVYLPPEDHPIFGKQGIMHGMAITSGDTYVRNTGYDKVHARRFGHNGLTVGDWFAYRGVALFRGAHGEQQAGIYGSESEGAYAIAVSSKYDGLDEDNGEVLYYCPPESKDHRDPRQLPEAGKGAKALTASMQKLPKRAVRVMRGAGPAYGPTVGYRYDGLYDVVDVRERKNEHDGLFQKFKLQRRRGQGSFGDLASRPNAEEELAFKGIPAVVKSGWQTKAWKPKGRA